MNELGLVVPFWIMVLIWLAKIVLLTLVAALLAMLGVRIIDALTPQIHKRQRIGENPVATGLYIAGFFIMIGLVIHGATTSYTAVGGSVVEYIFNFRTWGLLAVSFAISLVIGLAIFRIADKLTPKIPFLSIDHNPIAVGIYVFGYFIFFGLILHAALTSPL
jgi:uncharacterized membrane protein YjfL (UPF0719 family)